MVHWGRPGGGAREGAWERAWTDSRRYRAWAAYGGAWRSLREGATTTLLRHVRHHREPPHTWRYHCAIPPALAHQMTCSPMAPATVAADITNTDSRAPRLVNAVLVPLQNRTHRVLQQQRPA